MTNLEKFQEAIKPMTHWERAAARTYLIGYIIDGVPPDKFDLALRSVKELVAAESDPQPQQSFAPSR